MFLQPGTITIAIGEGDVYQQVKYLLVTSLVRSFCPNQKFSKLMSSSILVAAGRQAFGRQAFYRQALSMVVKHFAAGRQQLVVKHFTKKLRQKQHLLFNYSLDSDLRKE